VENRLLTIVFIDVQGFTKRTANSTREETSTFIEEIRAFVTQHLEKCQGRLVKTMGDGFMAAFDSPTNAVQCGCEMQRKLLARNANILNPEHFVRFRIGINTGEVGIDENGDLFGDPVNIAARIEGFAESGEVYISESTFLAMNRNEVGIVDLGPQMFKNATREIRVYKILGEGDRKPASANTTASPSASVLKADSANGGSIFQRMKGKPWLWAVCGMVVTLLLVFIGLKIAHRKKAPQQAPPQSDLSENEDIPLQVGEFPPPKSKRPGPIQEQLDAIEKLARERKFDEASNGVLAAKEMESSQNYRFTPKELGNMARILFNAGKKAECQAFLEEAIPRAKDTPDLANRLKYGLERLKSVKGLKQPRNDRFRKFKGGGNFGNNGPRPEGN